jgi:hypothetical protein
MDKNTKNNYKKLFSANVNFLGGNSVMRATDDHFLYCESNGYSEEYKRFFYSDIQAIKMVKKRDWAFILNLFFLACVVFITVFLADSTGALFVFGSIIAVLVVVALYCLIAGNPVEVKFITTYSSDRIILGRVWRTAKNLRKITAYLENAQNSLIDDANIIRLEEEEKIFKV